MFRQAIKSVKTSQDLLIEVSDHIWEFAELGLEEFKSSKLLTKTLNEAGFSVKSNIADMSTAFYADYGKGKPVIGILGEYDALPGLSQKAQPFREVRIKIGLFKSLISYPTFFSKNNEYSGKDMSKVIKWQYPDLFEPRREKLVNLLLSEIIFLKSHLKKLTLNEKTGSVEIALNKLDYLLNTLKNNDTELSDKDFDKVVLIIYQIFQEIINKIEGELKIK